MKKLLVALSLLWSTVAFGQSSILIPQPNGLWAQIAATCTGSAAANTLVCTPTINFSGTTSGSVFNNPQFTGTISSSALGITLQSLAQGGNTAVGGGPQEWALGQLNTNIAETTAFGDRAWGNLVSGSFDSAFGHDACGIGAGVNLTISSTICIGTDAGRNIASGASRNTIIGTGAAVNIAGTDNTISGPAAAASNFVAANQWVIAGSAAAPTLNNGSGGVIIGYRADITSGSANDAVIIGGNGAGGQPGARCGGASVCIGNKLGNANLTGTNNLLAGYNIATTNLTTGSRDILFGTSNSCDTPLSGTNDFFGLCLSATNSAYAIQANLAAATSSFTVNTSTFTVPNIALSGQSSALCWNAATGAITANSGVTTCLVSVARVKDLQRLLSPREGLDKVLAMRPWIYKPNSQVLPEGEQVGFVAEDVAKVDGRLVAHDINGNLSGVRYEQYTADLTGAIQQLHACLDSWKCRLFGIQP